MSEYGCGVLIHNYNEDRFGEDLVEQGKKTFRTPVSITHSAFRDPKVVEKEFRGEQEGLQGGTGDSKESGPPRATTGLEGHLLFGHAAEMRNTDGFRQKAFISSNQYFYQDPKKSADENNKSILTVESFYESQQPIEMSKSMTSCLAAKIKAGWQSDKNCYKSTYSNNFQNRPEGLEAHRIARIKGEFTTAVDSVKIHRNMQH